MIYKTIITDADISSVNKAHQVVQRVMHTPDDHKPCPAFIIAGTNTIIVQSSYKPASASAIVAETHLDDVAETNEVHLRVRIAAVRRDRDGNEKAVLKDNRIDTDYMSRYIVTRFAEFGLTPKGKVKISYAGKAGEPGHSMKPCPVCEADGVWVVSDMNKLEQLLVTKIGRRNFLGLGMVRVVSEC
jgi:hypothetical protein